MGDVYVAVFRDQKVAAKTIKGLSAAPDKKSKMYTELITELALLASVGQHPNIVHFIGAVTLTKPMLIMELVGGPTLGEYLHGHGEKEKKKLVLKNPTVAGWSRDLLSGVAHLHEMDPMIIHRDCELCVCVCMCMCVF